jgi:diacylglycerol kinase family enzyme
VIELLANPHARRHRADPTLLSSYRQLPGVTVHVTQTLDELPAACARIAAANPPLIAISGGDGTISLGISELRGAFGGRPLPPIIPLMGGTMNMVGHSIGIMANPRRALERILDMAAESRPTHVRDTLQVAGRTGFIFGLGLVTNFLEIYYDGPRTGPIKAAEVVARGVVGVAKQNAYAKRMFRRQAGTLRYDGLSTEAEWTAVLVQTIENLGIGFRPMYRAHERPGTFHMLATDLSAVQVVNHLPLIFRGRPWPTTRMRDVVTDRLEFAPPGGKGCSYTLDGELYSAGSDVLVEIGPPVTFVSTG